MTPSEGSGTATPAPEAGLPESLPVSALALLAILGERPMTGYELKKLVDSPEMAFWRDSFGSIYPNLQKLTRLGLTRETRECTGDRRRITYTLTEEGRRMAAAWLALPASTRPVKVELLLKLRFAWPLGEGAVHRLLEDYLAFQKNLLPDLFESLEYLDGLEDRTLRLETRRMAVDFQYRFARMLIEWCRASMERLDTHPEGHGS